MAKNVQNPCKTMLKSLRKTRANFCSKNKFFILLVQNSTFPPTFPYFPTYFPTTIPPLFIINLFHLSTEPITTIINKLEERN